VATLFKPQADSKEISFTWDAEKIILKIDSEQMTQAVLNLLQNALDATPKGEAIKLQLLKTPTEVLIEVSDTGSGIAPELQQKILNLYYTTKPTGTGMGLAITQQIISQHNGSLDLKNHFPRGTVFTISIPLF
jgi:signal transduction histidine kinase